MKFIIRGIDRIILGRTLSVNVDTTIIATYKQQTVSTFNMTNTDNVVQSRVFERSFNPEHSQHHTLNAMASFVYTLKTSQHRHQGSKSQNNVMVQKV